MTVMEQLKELEQHGGDCPYYIRDECDECGVCELYDGYIKRKYSGDDDL